METNNQDVATIDDSILYQALLKGEGKKVMDMCKTNDKVPLHAVTIHKDTVLHMATYSKQVDLVFDLLNSLPDSDMFENNIAAENGMGNTILHEAATSDCLVHAAKLLLYRAPHLLDKRNKRGETALFTSAMYGKAKMFSLLDEKVHELLLDKQREGDKLVEARRKFHERDDHTTILHISIITEHFDLALSIAKEHTYLVNCKDGDGMTALQLLACNSSAFKKELKKKSCFTRLIYSCFSSKVTMETDEAEDQPWVTVPLWKAIRMKHYSYECAVDLAKFLIQRDTSWKETESAGDRTNARTHNYKYSSTDSSTSSSSDPSGISGSGSASEINKNINIMPAQDQPVPTVLTSKKKKAAETGLLFLAAKFGISEIVEEILRLYPQAAEEKKKEKGAETPLFLAAKFGISEIVEEILRLYPQAVEYIDDEGCNILHVAIKHRQTHIFWIVEKMEIPMMRLIRKTDNLGNSILHMAGMKADERNIDDMRNPALVLQGELLLFESVEKITLAHFTKHLNDKGETAEHLFFKNYDDLRQKAKDWLRGTSENCSIIAVLIATVAFAAAYTVPGGPNQNTGYPLLENHPLFVIFTLTDALSLTLALSSVIVFTSILTSGFRMKDFKQSLIQKLMLGITLLILSVSMMMLAFVATVVMLIRNKHKFWTRIALYSVSFFPVCIFAVLYLPLYLSLMSTFKYSISKIWSAFPRLSAAFIGVQYKRSIPDMPNDLGPKQFV